jgi:hypothetical protein
MTKDKNSIYGRIVEWDENGNTIAEHENMELRVCFAENPKEIEISHEDAERLCIYFDFEQLKELVNRKQYENT